MTELNTLEDFLEDDRFREWIKFPDADNSAYWGQWLEEHPLQRPVFETAVAAMASLAGKAPEISDDYINKKIGGIKERLATHEPIGHQVVHRQMGLLRWAAVFAAVLGLGWVLLNRNVSSTRRMMALESSPEDTVRSFSNTKRDPLLVNLPDGSSVVLSKGSRLEYDLRGGVFSREVRLVGEGFFEVAKDPVHPFFVYTARLTTRVVGTSFLIRSFDNEPKATVTVRTGKVSVTPKNAAHNPDKSGAKTLVLNPDEKVSLVVATEEMIREKLERADQNPLPDLLKLPKYEFHHTPVGEVFALLEKAYGVPIKYDAQSFEHCTLTATLSDEPFTDKIKMICMGIEAGFEVRSNEVIITGDGCSPR
jgi:ferric-dicitrate binding protein FerR (iron transport regulator)